MIAVGPGGGDSYAKLARKCGLSFRCSARASCTGSVHWDTIRPSGVETSPVSGEKTICGRRAIMKGPCWKYFSSRLLIGRALMSEKDGISSKGALSSCAYTFRSTFILALFAVWKVSSFRASARNYCARHFWNVVGVIAQYVRILFLPINGALF